MKYPYFPRPLLSEFDLKIPILAGENSTDRNELEETRLRHDILLSLQKDTAAATAIDVEERVEISNRENNIDRALLQLMMLVCREDGQGAKALDICGLFTQKRTLDMASKVAQKYDHQVLAGKIEELRNEMDED